MAKQSIVSITAIAAIQDDLCNWEFVNHSDESDDDVSSYEGESVDLVQSIDSLSSDDDEEVDHDHHDGVEEDEEREGGKIDEVVPCSRVSDLGQNQVDLSNCGDKIDGFLEYNNGSNLNLSGYHQQHQDHHDEVVNDECSRVSDLGQNHVIHDQLSDSVDDQQNIDGFFECNNGSSLNSSGHDHDDDEDDHDDDDGYDMDDELVPWEVKDKFVRQRIRKTGKISIIGRNARSSKKSALVFTRPGCVRGKHGLGLKVY